MRHGMALLYLFLPFVFWAKCLSWLFEMWMQCNITRIWGCLWITSSLIEFGIPSIILFYTDDLFEKMRVRYGLAQWNLVCTLIGLWPFSRGIQLVSILVHRYHPKLQLHRVLLAGHCRNLAAFHWGCAGLIFLGRAQRVSSNLSNRLRPLLESQAACLDPYLWYVSSAAGEYSKYHVLLRCKARGLGGMARQVECDEDQGRKDVILERQQSNATLMGALYLKNAPISSPIPGNSEVVIMTYPAMPTDWGYCKTAVSASQYTGVTLSMPSLVPRRIRVGLIYPESPQAMLMNLSW